MVFLDTVGKRVKKNLTAYDMFALTVVVMIFGHLAYYFYADNNILRLPDRMLVPVFLISIGYNAGRKTTTLLLMGACVMSYMHFIITEEIYGDVLVTIILARTLLHPTITFSLKSNFHFWGIFCALTALIPFTSQFMDYGSLAIIMAMAGWINKNRSEVPKNITTPAQFFVMAYLAFLFGVNDAFHYDLPLFILLAFGAGFVFWILYDFKTLLLNSIKRRPRDPVEKICSLLGHKSLEIYIAHMIIIQIIFIAAVIGVL